MSGIYKIEVEDTVEYQHVSPERKKTYEASGHMAVSKDSSTIDVMERPRENELNIHSWKKKTR